jgi:TPR repeat protein
MTKPAYLLIICAVSAFSDPFYELAMVSIDNPPANMTEIISLFNISAALGNSKAYTRLGEVHLFGYMKNNRVYRNYTEAIRYFQYGIDLGDGDSCFYLNIINQESLLTNEFDGFTQTKTHDQILIDAKNCNLNFILAKTAYLNYIVQSNKLRSFDIPSFFIDKDLNSSVFVPFFKKKDYQVKKTHVYESIKLANDSIQHTESSILPQYTYKKIDLELESIDKDIKNSLLYSKHPNLNFFNLVALGDYYLLGNPLLGIPKDLGKALKTYEKALELKNFNSLSRLAKLYLYGWKDLEQDRPKALYYLKKGLKSNSDECIHLLGDVYRTGNGVSIDYTLALGYYKAAADNGYIPSLNCLGEMYYYGLGVSKNVDLALKYFSIAAKQDYYKAKYNIGLAIFEGIHFPQSNENALQLFLEVTSDLLASRYIANAYKSYSVGDAKGFYLYFLVASALGSQNARESLSYIHEKSLNPNLCKSSKDYCTGFYLLKSLVHDRSEYSYQKMGKLLYKASPPDYEKAYEYYSNAITSGEALYMLGYMTEEGQGCEQSYEKALSIYNSIIIRASHYIIDPLVYYPGLIGKIRVIMKSIIDEYTPISITI